MEDGRKPTEKKHKMAPYSSSRVRKIDLKSFYFYRRAVWSRFMVLSVLYFHTSITQPSIYFRCFRKTPVSCLQNFPVHLNQRWLNVSLFYTNGSFNVWEADHDKVTVTQLQHLHICCPTSGSLSTVWVRHAWAGSCGPAGPQRSENPENTWVPLGPR